MKTTITSQELLSCVREAELRMRHRWPWEPDLAMAARLVVYGYAMNQTITVADDTDFVQNVRDALLPFPDSLSRFDYLIGV